MRLSGADIIVRTIIEQGTKTVFGYPGGQIINVYDSLYKYRSELRHVLCAHEQGAAHAADGYARATGEVGVVIATSGPGATNLVTGIATAYLDSTPLVAITGNVPSYQLGTDSFQEIDITGITLPITKHNYVVGNVEELSETIREAYRLAMSDRPGPVLVDVPKDIQIAQCEYEPLSPAAADPKRPAKDVRVEEAAACINEAHRPYVYFGGGLINSDAQEELLELIGELNARRDVNGILVQLPVPGHIDEEKILLAIDPGKDVDGFHPVNVGNLSIGRPGYVSCTPAGVIQLLKRSGITIEGKECVVLGRSNIVGKPMAMLLLQENGTVTVCHSRTKNLKEIARRADILVAAIGRPKFIDESFVKEGAVVIDVGIHRNADNKLCGDVDFERVAPHCSAITPVPGGVGPMTIAMLMSNCVNGVLS